jgi:hypothetical protein
MPFTKGQSGNPDGRPQGSKNKTPADLLELLKRFAIDNFEQFKKDFDSLTPELRCSLWLKAMLHIVPKAEPDKKELVGGYVVHVVDTPELDIKSEDMN